MPESEARRRILIVAPSGRDGQLAEALLAAAGLRAELCDNVEALCKSAKGSPPGVCVIAEEALGEPGVTGLDKLIESQPAWSDLPIVIIRLRAPGKRRSSAEARIPRGNVTLLERPLRTSSFLSTLRSALRARKRQYDAEQAIVQRDTFLAMLSHELRNPLAAVMLATDALRDGHASTAQVDLIARQARHLTRLVDDLLDVSRITTGKIELRRNHVSLGDVVDAALMIVPSGERQRVRVIKTGAPVVVHGDSARLEQVFTNLVTNAVKYTPPPGGVTVELRAVGNEAVVCVRDSGIGIAPAMLPRIFDIFVQADGALARSQGGMGVGLTLAKSLVAMHSGQISAESDGPGKGSTFTVRLPLSAAKDTAPPPAAPQQSDEQPRSIVVIEDSDDVRETMELILERAGHSTSSESDGLRGLELLLAKRPDIAFVDLGLPSIDGFEIARRARATLGADVRLIALSGYGLAEDKARAIAAGFDVHLTKPVDRSVLLQLAQNVG